MSTATSKWTPEYKREYNRKYYEKNRKRLSNYCKKYYKNKKIKKDIDARLGDLEYRLNLCWYDKGQSKIYLINLKEMVPYISSMFVVIVIIVLRKSMSLITHSIT